MNRPQKKYLAERSLVHPHDVGRPVNLWNYITCRLPILSASVADLLRKNRC